MTNPKAEVEKQARMTMPLTLMPNDHPSHGNAAKAVSPRVATGRRNAAVSPLLIAYIFSPFSVLTPHSSGSKLRLHESKAASGLVRPSKLLLKKALRLSFRWKDR